MTDPRASTAILLIFLLLAAPATLGQQTPAAEPACDPGSLSGAWYLADARSVVVELCPPVALVPVNAVLYLDEIPFEGLPNTAYTPAPDELVEADPSRLHRRFVLQRNPENSAAWRQLYELNARTLGEVRIDVGVGSKGQAPLPTAAGTAPEIEMRIVPASRIIWPSAVILVLGLAFIVLLKRSRLIRAVSAGTPASAPAPEIPYSLGRTQMAVWFFLVGASYLFIWAATGEVNVLSASELVLLGIAGGTALSAVVIEGSASAERLDKRRRDIETVRADIAKAKTEHDDLMQGQGEDEPTDPERSRKLAALSASIARSEYALDTLEGRSHGFIRDLISDTSGTTFHRFQIVGWTLVLGLIYVANVVTDLSLPQFDETTLGLMGISSGTYLGFKFPEPKEPGG